MEPIPPMVTVTTSSCLIEPTPTDVPQAITSPA
ncbi:uncharacterized protein METZ01_LOCUS390409, partial [marine metagenome]